MKTKLIFAPLLILVMLVASCAGTVGFRQTAAVTKISAEVAYDAIYTGHLHGLVSKETKDEAARWYDAYVVTQTLAVTAIQDEDYQTAADKIAIAQSLMRDLIILSVDLGLIESATTEEVL